MGYSNKIKLTKCIGSCGCYYCGKNIKLKEKYLLIYRNAWRGLTRTNVCLLCLENLYKTINQNELKKIKKVVRKKQRENKLRNIENAI